MLVLLGQNNHGKSNVLGALNFALNSSVKPEKDELFAFTGPSDKTMWVELTFDRLTDQERTTFKKYVQADGTFCIRKTAVFHEDNKPSVEYKGYVSEPEQDWLKSANASEYQKREVVVETPLKSYVEKSGRLTKTNIENAQQKYIDEHRENLDFKIMLEETPLLGQKNVVAGVLPEFILVPAVRDLSDESKVKSTAVFGRLLTIAVREMTATDPGFSHIQEQLSGLIANLNATPDSDDRPEQLIVLEASIEEELSEWDVSVSVEVKAPDISKIFELGTDIHLDDGLKTLAERKGHGLQRAVIFGLMKAWAKAMRRTDSIREYSSARKASESIIFAIEEPELFLHPHAQRALDSALRVLSRNNDNQVLVCSHSTHFVNLNDYRGVVLVRKTSAKEGTKIVQCTQDLFEGEDAQDRKRRFHIAQWVNPDRGEMFFARRVTFVEGETEKAVFPYLAKKLDCYAEDRSIIDCGSKNNIPLYVAIANAFHLDYVVIHDEDPLPDPMSTSLSTDKIEARQRSFELNTKIQSAVGESGLVKVLTPYFEKWAEVPINQAKSKGKALAALDHFALIEPENLPLELVEVVRLIYGESSERV